MIMLILTGLCFAVVVALYIFELYKTEANLIAGVVAVLMVVGSFYFPYIVGKLGLLLEGAYERYRYFCILDSECNEQEVHNP